MSLVELAPRTVGQNLLRNLSVTGADVARALGVSKQTVSCWRSGKKLPEPSMRRALETAYAIPCAAWEQQSTPLPVPPPAPPPAPSFDTLTTRDEVRAAYAGLRARKEALPASAAESERTKLDDLMLKALSLLARMDEREEQALERFMKSPDWRRMRAALVGALDPYPDAAQAVATALETL